MWNYKLLKAFNIFSTSSKFCAPLVNIDVNEIGEVNSFDLNKN